MKRFTTFACFALALVFAMSSFASDMPRFTQYTGNEVLVGGGQSFAKASRDTQMLIGPNGSGAQVIGTFQDGSGNANWNGWTHVDLTQPTTIRWHASTYFAVTGVYSAWCGEDIPSCGVGDPDGGYANGYNEMLEWRGAVANNALSCTVTVTANLQHDTEPGYDYTWLSYEVFDTGFVNVVSWDGAGLEAVNESFSYSPGDYMGGGANEVVVLFRVTADGGWSDSDCSWPTAGACQLDDVAITLSNGTGYSHDFEDGTLGAFTVRFPVGVGDFAKIWTGLEDFDPCFTNYTPQAAFIDDGIVVPGTGGTPCVNWCYGPSGFIVNTTGGLAGPDNHLYNAIESPVANWIDPTHNGAVLTFGVYAHEDLSPDAPGMFYTWSVRSAAPGGDISTAGWLDRNFVYYGGGVPGYFRPQVVVSDLLEPGRTEIQVQFTAYELGWVWGWSGNDGYPAPYFDNVRFETFPIIGPGLTTREIDIAQDNFPAIGQVDYLNLGDNSVRFDMANNISLITHELNDPGDSIVFYATVTRAGAALTGKPRMYYTMLANPVFDPYRTTGLPTTGFVECDTVKNAAGIVVADKYFADLPDTGFFFPGDIIHYYFEATDDTGGDPQTSILPADTTGFSNFDPYQPLAYNSSFTVRALPTVNAGLTHPTLLFWNDFANRGGQAEWHGALANLGLVAGLNYDVYYTNGPSSGVGNGLGGRATQFHLDGYTDMLYTCGNLSINTIANGDYNSDPSKDAELLTLWLNQTDRDFFGSGDDLAADMAGAGAVTQNLLQNYMGLSVISTDVRPLINSQTAPRILVEAGNPVFSSVSSWIAFGGCAGINIFDAVTPLGGAQRLAEFANKTGAPGGYAYSAATLNHLASGGDVITTPYDLMYLYTDANEGSKAAAQLSARARFLKDVLAYFGVADIPGQVTDAPNLEKFAVRNYPNPFNPKTSIYYTAPSAAKLTVKIYNIRGELVKTLFDAQVAAGTGSVEWDGSNNAGSKVSSGVYFYNVKLGSDEQSGKLSLVK